MESSAASFDPPLTCAQITVLATEGSPTRPRTPKRRPEPITKTDFTDYLRCPFTFWLIAHGDITREQSINPGLLHLLSDGHEFEEDLYADDDALSAIGAAVVRDPREEQQMLASGAIALKTGVYENVTLGLRGIPDGIDPANGAMVPIEIKSHAKPSRLDRLELAFYWLLLAPQRQPGDHVPRGRLILRGRDTRPTSLEINLSEQDLEDVRRRLPAIRKARRYRPRPQVCACYVCSVLYRREVRSRARHAQDVSMLNGIGRSFSEVFRESGIRTYGQLLDHDMDELLDLVNAKRKRFGPNQMLRWVEHARAYVECRPVFFGEPAEMPRDYVCLDLEYLTFADDLVWGAGVQRRDGELVQFWADGPREEPKLLEDLSRALDENGDIPVVTWNGTGADLPALNRAATRHGMSSPLDDRDHLDLYLWTSRHLRLPTPGLSLKEIASFLELTRISDEVHDGFMTQFRYQQAVRDAGTASGDLLKTQLLEYNADDVMTLAAIVDVFGALMSYKETSSEAVLVPLKRPSGAAAVDADRLASFG